MTPPLGVQHAGIQRGPGHRELGHVVRQHVAQELAHACPGQVDHAHVRHVEDAGVPAHRAMLVELGAVGERHVPAAEIDDLGARGNVDVVERCFQAHRNLAANPDTEPARTGWCVPPLCPSDLRDRAPARALLPFGGSTVAGATALQRSRETAVHVPERFRAVAPSAVLGEGGHSPHGSYRDAASYHRPRGARSARRSGRQPPDFLAAQPSLESSATMVSR